MGFLHSVQLGRGFWRRLWCHWCAKVLRAGREQEIIDRESGKWWMWSKTPPRCERCLEILQIGSNFCNHCGSPLPVVVEHAARDTDRISAAEINKRVRQVNRRADPATITGQIKAGHLLERGMSLREWYSMHSKIRMEFDPSKEARP